MITTLLGSILGFVTSLAPDVLKYYQDKTDKHHELQVMRLQIEREQRAHEHRLAEVEVEADVAQTAAIYEHDRALAGGSTWVQNLRASVRPVVTYAFFSLYAAVKAASLWVLITVEGMLLAQALPAVWTEADEALWAAIVTFWFGRRAMEKYRQAR